MFIIKKIYNVTEIRNVSRTQITANYFTLAKQNCDVPVVKYTYLLVLPVVYF